MPANKTGPILSLVGALAVVIGSFLPWATVTSGFGSIGVAGTEGDGVITLVAGAVIGILAALELGQSSKTRVATMIASLICLGIGLFEIANVSDAIGGVSSEFARASVGIGLFAVAGGAGLAIFGSTLSR